MERQNYKIYVNGTPLFLASREGLEALGLKQGKFTHVAFYPGRKRYIKQYLDLLDKFSKVEAVVIWCDDLEKLWADFQDCFKGIEAAGGYVVNPEKKLLVFFRRGSWDMPKGKIDDGESPEQAAVREVREETGLQNLELGQFLCHTYHTYMAKGSRMLKKTWWFRMQTTDNQVVPQTEEDIEEIQWIAPKAWLSENPKIYGSILDVILLADV